MANAALLNHLQDSSLPSTAPYQFSLSSNGVRRSTAELIGLALQIVEGDSPNHSSKIQKRTNDDEESSSSLPRQ
jgi:hypothetical protein